MLQSVLDWVVGVMSVVGAPGVGFATFLETIFPPIPSEVVLPMAGYTAAMGRYGVLAAVLWATLGSVLGALLLYWAGAVWGVDRLRRIADRLPLASSKDIDKAMGWFARNGRLAVLLGRLVPGVRSLISIPAGVDRMPLRSFLAFTTIGSAIWNGVLVYFGYALGARWAVVGEYVDVVSNVVYVGLAAVVAVVVVRRLASRGE